jgi:hypothetical protein
MKKERYIRISGWALILGAITLTLASIAVFTEPFRTGLIPTTVPPESTTNLALLGPLLLAIGMLGLLYRYGDEVGRLGKGALAIGAISGFVAASTSTILSIDLFTGLFNEVWANWADEWIVWMTGPHSQIALNGLGVLMLSGLGVGCLSLIVFGVTALIRKPLPRWNWLPILAGIVPFMIAAGLVLEGPSGSERLFSRGNTVQLIWLAVSISAVILVLLGYVLQTDTHRDSAIA